MGYWPYPGRLSVDAEEPMSRQAAAMRRFMPQT